MLLFVLATCFPATMIVFAALFGGPWPFLALGSMTMMVAGLDHCVARVTAPLPEQDSGAADILSAFLAFTHLILLPFAVFALSGDDLPAVAKICLYLACGFYFGQVSNANAHELIHRRGRFFFNLGKLVYISVLFGHHVSGHLLIHHRYVGTLNDPSTSRLGESFYRYVTRAWIDTFRLGFVAEARRLRRIQRPRSDNPFVAYILGSLGFTLLAFVIGGGTGVVWFLGICAFSQLQLLLCDYVQHYGLERKIDENGRLEPIHDKHSWNAPHWYSSGMMLNAPRHSDHHAHPYRPYPMLALPSDGPMLPRSLPAMAVMALFPKLWRRIMDRRVQHWKDIAAS